MASESRSVPVRAALHKVWVVDADGANRRQFAKTQLSDGPDITWSPGRDILYQKPGRPHLNILDPETGEEKPLIQNDSLGVPIQPDSIHPMGRRSQCVGAGRRNSASAVISLIDNSETFLYGDGNYV